MGFGNFWQGMVGSPVGQWAKGVDTSFKDRAITDEIALRQGRLRRGEEAVMNMNDQQLRDRLRSDAGMSDEGAQSVVDEFMGYKGSMDAQGMQQVARRVAPSLNGGPFQIGKMGLREQISSQAANNRYVRRGAYPALIAGGTVAGGAALTAGAQQLMALMAYMNESEATEQRVEQSPLA